LVIALTNIVASWLPTGGEQLLNKKIKVFRILSVVLILLATYTILSMLLSSLRTP